MTGFEPWITLPNEPQPQPKITDLKVASICSRRLFKFNFLAVFYDKKLNVIYL